LQNVQENIASVLNFNIARASAPVALQSRRRAVVMGADLCSTLGGQRTGAACGAMQAQPEVVLGVGAGGYRPVPQLGFGGITPGKFW